MQTFDNSYDITPVFNSFFKCKGLKFNPPNIKLRGISDGNNGVQWNSTIDLELNHLRLGVNLEGMKYGDYNWPIANFIENELKESKLLSISPPESKDIIIGITRDAWQANVRPLIKEKIIGGKKIPLNSLTNELWEKMLTEAYACLDENKNHRTRAKQKVNLVGKGEKLMEVSPHLNIYKVMYDNYTPRNFNEALNLIQECYKSLLDIYEVVVYQSKS